MFLRLRHLSTTVLHHLIANNEVDIHPHKAGIPSKVAREDILKVPAELDKILW